MSLFSKRSELEVGPPPALAPGTNHNYGIDDAVQLMRTLPMTQNADLVLLVIRNTLASMNVELKRVIDDGGAKEGKLRNKIASIKGAIAELERELEERRAELAAVEADLAETSLVKERLEMAASKADPIVLPPGLGSSAPPGKAGSTAPRPPLRGRPAASPTDEDRHTMEIEPEPESSPAQEKAH
jgi:hypothetical protein